MATAGDIITASFLKIGISTPTTAQTASALISLNNMMSLLGADLFTYSVTSETLAITAGDAEYTIGTTGDSTTARPIQVRNMRLRDSDNYDHPLGPLAGKDYNEITYKLFSGRPSGFYFLPEYPNAKIIFDAYPDTTYTAYFEFVKNFTEFAATTTDVELPAEYKEALVYNLAISLAEDWDRAVSKTVQLRAIETRQIIDRLNASQNPPPKAKFDLIGSYGYNITTDE